MAISENEIRKRNFLFQLVRSALWNDPMPSVEMPSKMAQSLFDMAKKQTIEGLVTECLMSNNIRLPKEEAFRVYRISQDVAKSNSLVNDALSELCTLLNENDIRYVVVKGQTIAALYRKPSMRTPGDIDFYCDETNFPKAKEILRTRWHVEFEEDDTESEQHVAFSYKGVPFELHFCLIKFSSQSIQDSFDRYLQNVTTECVLVNQTNVPVLSAELNVLYTFLHLYHHLVELGVSIRQFCDLAVLLNNLQLRKEVLESMLNEIGFMRAFKVVGFILVNCLGLKKEKFPFQLSEKDKKHVWYMLDIVFSHGNFGMYNRKYKVRSGVGYYIESFKTKISHYWHLYRLSPKESRAVLMSDIPKKILLAAKR